MARDALPLSRRTLLGWTGAAAALGALPVSAQTPSEERIDLWPGAPPGAIAGQSIIPSIARGRGKRMIAGIASPYLVIRRATRPSGAAMLLLPGGGYRQEGIDTGGTLPSAFLNAHGITTFMLAYRLPGEGWANRAAVPMQDAQRAIRLIRSRAASFALQTNRIGVMGFSAGGHLAGSLATRFDDVTYPPRDAADRFSARPDLAVLMFPVISLAAPYVGAAFQTHVLGDKADAAGIEHYSVDRRVSATTPPVLLMQCADDTVVSVKHSILMYEAMLAAHRPVAMHLFEKGGHGFSTDVDPALPVSAWPGLVLKFTESQGWPRGPK